MYRTNRSAVLSGLTSLLLLLGLTAPAVASAAPNYSDFTAKSQLLMNQENGTLTVDSGKHAHLNRGSMVKKKVSTDNIEFLQQLTDFSNDVVDASQTDKGIDGAASKLAQYPKVQQYFKQATDFTQSGQTLSLKKQSQHNPVTSFAIIGNPVSEALGMADCGIYWSPKPTTAKNRVYINTSNPVGLMQSWGYHDSHIPGAGWTRAQTWHPWNCGFFTFRDNAAQSGPTQIWEQNYNGWNPRGEPNPEVYVSGPWPYTTWPAYVYWWHQTH